MSNKKEKEALLLAGKLAIASWIAIGSNIHTISENLKNLKKVLKEYDDYIMEWAVNKDEKMSERSRVATHCPVSGTRTLCTVKECDEQFKKD